MDESFVVGVLRLEFTLHDNESIKDKRNVAASLKRKLRNKFNVAVAEIGNIDSRSVLELAVTSVGRDREAVESRLQKALNMVEAAATEELTDSSLDFF